ncbi:MAG TPA: hypothetical protein VK824_03425 [Planctomycetota bacterium]|nr:hypothetical protein [Planctomycetota bacterium]
MDLPPFVLVLGMHRSGTSCLAGALERCGVYLGEVARSDRHNAKGNLELDAARLLDDSILETCGGAWDRPPAQVVASAEQRAAMSSLVAELARRRPCGLKDPRMLLTLAAWLEAVGPSATPIGTYRHPAAVAHSLARRNAMPEPAARALWLRYNRELVAAHRRRPFPVIAFDLRDPQAYCETVAQVAERAGLRPDRPRLLDFVSAELDHAPEAGGEIAPDCREVHAYLEAVREPWASARPAPAPGGPARSGRTLLHLVCGPPAAGKSAWIARHGHGYEAVLLPDKGALASVRAGAAYLVHYNLLRPWAKLRVPEGARWWTVARQFRRRLRSAVSSPFVLDRRLGEFLERSADVRATLLVAPREVLLARLAARRATASAEAAASDEDWEAVLAAVDLGEAYRECARFLRSRGVTVDFVDATDPAWPASADEAALLARLAR